MGANFDNHLKPKRTGRGESTLPGKGPRLDDLDLHSSARLLHYYILKYVSFFLLLTTNVTWKCMFSCMSLTLWTVFCGG